MPLSSLSEPLLRAITEHWLRSLTPHVQAFLYSLQMTRSQNISPALAIILPSSSFIPLLPRQRKPEEREGDAAVFWSTFILCCGCMGVGEGKGGVRREGVGEKERELRVIPPPLLCSSPQKNVTVDRAL